MGSGYAAARSLRGVSHRKVIRNALLAGKKVSPLTALRDFGCMRLASRILEIRQGYSGDPALDVEDQWRKKKDGPRYKVYFVAEAASERQKAVLLANSKAGARPPGRPRLAQARSWDSFN